MHTHMYYFIPGLTLDPITTNVLQNTIKYLFIYQPSGDRATLSDLQQCRDSKYRQFSEFNSN